MMSFKSIKEQRTIEQLQDALSLEGLGYMEVTRANKEQRHALVKGDYADILLARKTLSNWRVDRDIS
jgi:hypothetical protein